MLTQFKLQSLFFWVDIQDLKNLFNLINYCVVQITTANRELVFDQTHNLVSLALCQDHILSHLLLIVFHLLNSILTQDLVSVHYEWINLPHLVFEV